MLSWFSQSEPEKLASTDPNDQVPSISTTPEILDLVLEMSQASKLFNEIREFDKDNLEEVYQLNRYYFYDLLDEIKNFDKTKLKYVLMKDESTFLTKLQYTLEVITINDRVKQFGKDIGYSYTDDEYKNSYEKLLKIEFRNRFQLAINLSIGLITISCLGLLCDDNPPFLIGLYISNILLYSSILFGH